ncbi:MAG: hypothetical protein ACI8TV_001048, partial [Porticoccaceae bacterium]
PVYELNFSTYRYLTKEQHFDSGAHIFHIDLH